jgi:hypothetical protein
LKKPDAATALNRVGDTPKLKNTEIMLKWDGINITELASRGGDDANQIVYDLFGDMVDGEQGQRIATLPFNVFRFNHGGLTPGSYWYYKLYVRNRGSNWSPPIFFQARAIGCPLYPPVVPKATIIYEDAIYLTWPKVEDPDRRGHDNDANLTYRLYYNSTPTYHEGEYTNVSNMTNFHPLSSQGVNFTTFNHTELTRATFYSYRMSVRNELCEGPLTASVVYNTTPFGVPGVIETPTLTEPRYQPGFTITFDIP